MDGTGTNDVLYVHPIKQGLKHAETRLSDTELDVLYVHPIKQGLKHSIAHTLDTSKEMFFMYIQ